MPKAPVLFSSPARPHADLGYDASKGTQGVYYINLGFLDKPNTPPLPWDFSYLGDKDLAVYLRPVFSKDYLNFQPGEHVQLGFYGQADDGSSVSWSTAYTATAGTKVFYVPSNKLKALAGRQATLQYVVRSTHSGVAKIRYSYPAVFDIRGIKLPALDLVEAIDDSIDPDRISKKAGLEYVTVKLDYPGMAVGDTVKLVREGVDVNQKQINFVDKDRPISASNIKRRPMTITWLNTDLMPLVNGVMTIYYQVYRDGVWYSSPKRIINVGPSLVSLPPFINEVKEARLDPDLIADSINLHIPPAGTIVGDKVTIHWSDTSKQTFTDEGVVTQQNVDGDMSFDIYLDDPINLNRGKVVTVFYILERTLPNGRKVSFRSSDYRFFVGSQKEQEAADSKPLTVPSIEGVTEEVMNPALANSGAKIRVPFAETQEGDSVTAYWLVVGEKDATALGTQLVDSANVNADLSFAIPPAAIKAALNKKVIGYYVITRKGLDGKTKEFRSSPLSFSVGPLAPTALLPAPRVPASAEGVLDPMKATNGTAVVVGPYPTIAVGDKVRVFWVGMDGPGAPDVPVQTVSDVTKSLTFNIPVSAIGANIGAEVWVYYQVTRAGVAKPIDSQDTIIELELLGHDDLPEPVVDQSRSGTLDMGVTQGNITVSIAKWPFIAVGQRVWVRIEGTTKGGSALQTVIWTSRPLTEQDAKNGLKISIERAYIEGLKEGTELSVFASLTHDGDFSDEYAEAFPVATVLIKQAKSAETSPGGGSSGDTQVITASPSRISLNAAYPKAGSSSKAPAGSSQLLVIGGGKAPYSYESQNPNVAEVDATGLVKAKGNGTTYIKVTDSKGAVIYIEVTNQGMIVLVGLNFSTYTGSKEKADELGLVIPSLAIWEKLRAEGGGKVDVELISGKTPIVWTSDSSGLGKRTAFDPATGKTEDLKDLGIMGGTAHGFGMKL